MQTSLSPIRWVRVLLVVLFTLSISALASAAPAGNRPLDNQKRGRVARSQQFRPDGAGPDGALAYTVFPQVQIPVDGWVDYNRYTCTVISSGVWTVTTPPNYGVTATAIVYLYLGNGDCPGILFPFNVIYYTWTSTNPSAQTDYFAATWSSPDGLVNDTVNITLASVTIQSPDLIGNNISVTTVAPSGTTGALTLKIKGANNTFTVNYNNISPVGPGQYSFTLTRPNIVKDTYSSVEADWASTPPLTGTFTLSPPWIVLGTVSNTVYIKVYEDACSGSPASPYWTFTPPPACVFTPIQLKAAFSTATNENGSGETSGGTLVHTNKADELCLSNINAPQEATNLNTYQTISEVDGSCKTLLIDGTSIAVYPYPTGGGPYSCNDNFLYVDNSNQNAYYPKAVQDSCSHCGITFSTTVDNYRDNGECDALNLPNYWEADLGTTGGEIRIPVSGPMIQTAESQQASYRDDQITVESSRVEHTFVVSITSDHGRKDVELPVGIMKIEGIRRFANRLIVISEIAHGASQVVVLDINSGTVRDSFLAWDAVVSPDGRFIAFDKWYLSEADVRPEDHIMLYDMTKNALENRPAGVAPNDDTNVGFNVYPGNSNKDGDNVHVPEQFAHRLRGSLFWSPDSTKLAFADQAQSSMRLVLVNVPGANTGGTPSASILSLDKAGLCPAAPWPNYYCDAYLGQVKFLENGLDTFFQKQGAAAHRKLRVKYADFTASR